MRFSIITQSKINRRQSRIDDIVGDLQDDELLLFITKHDIEHGCKNIEAGTTFITDGTLRWVVTGFYYNERPSFTRHRKGDTKL